jgi:phenylacetate-CoA ligase
MNRVSGRMDDMLIINGINIFPSQIEECLIQFKGIEPHYQIIVDRVNGADTIEILVEPTNQIEFFDVVGAFQDLKQRLQKHLEDSLDIRLTVTFVKNKALERSGGNKLRHIIDKREQ